MRTVLKCCLNLLYFGHTNEISEAFLSVLITHVLSDHRIIIAYVRDFKLARTYEDFQGVFMLGFVLLGFVIFYTKVTEGDACMG